MGRRTNDGRRRLVPAVNGLEDRTLPSAPPSPFARVADPAGMVTDASGNVFVSFVESSPGGLASVIGEFSPRGDFLGQAILSSGIVAFPGSLTTVPASAPSLGGNLAQGDLLELLPGGQIMAYRPSTGAIWSFLYIPSLPTIDTSAIGDVATGRTSDFGGRIAPRQAVYNDIAVQGSSILVTGYSSHPFMLRLSFSAGSLQAAKVLVSSSASEPGNTSAPGVAVNARGLVLTTLPIGQGGNLSNGIDVPVGFGIDFDRGIGRVPYVAIASRVDSLDIATDSLGNFVIATGPAGSALSTTPGSLVAVTAGLTRFTSLPPTASSSTDTRAVAIAPDNGTVYVAYPDVGQVWSVWYTPLPATAGDYNGDGKADLAVFRPPTAEWFFYGLGAAQFGGPGDVPVPADYNADGRTDVAVFRPSTCQWFIAGLGAVQFGAPGDIPLPADYDGDGKADLAVFRPSTNEWFIRGSRSGGRGLQFGAPGDIPVPADYDGDGKADLAVFRPSMGEWFILGSQGGGQLIQFGAPGLDIPIPADYGGDGKADLAVYRPSTGVWYVRNMGAVAFGQAGVDIPVPADYAGDGRADFAVFRPTTATWFILGVGGYSFGQANVDIPTILPAAYRYAGVPRVRQSGFVSTIRTPEATLPPVTILDPGDPANGSFAPIVRPFEFLRWGKRPSRVAPTA